MKKFVSIIIGFALLLQTTSTVYASEPIVKTQQVYSYERLTKDIQQLQKAYPHLIQYHSIGKTPYGRDLWAVKLGNGSSTVFLNGAHHAREWMTSTLLMKMMEQYASAYENNATIGKYPAKEILNETSIWFVPMVNPDGVTLQQFGVKAFPQNVQKQLIRLNGGSTDFKRWKANAQGIDLNRQYPADWENIRYNKSYPAFSHHKGNKPLQTLETQAIHKFTKEINPEIAVAYHSSGRILYWYFNNKPENLQRDKQLARTFKDYTDYTLVTPRMNPSGGGYTDWFIQEFGRPGFTPEISYYVGHTHVPLSVFPEIWNRNKEVGLWIAEEGHKLWLARNGIKIKQKEQLLQSYQTQLAQYKQNQLTDAVLNDTKEKLFNILIALEQLEEAITLQEEFVLVTKQFDQEVERLNQLYAQELNQNGHIYINQKPIQNLLFENGNLFLPVREFAKAYNLNLSVQPNGKMITLENQNTSLNIEIGNTLAYINEQSIDLQKAPTLYNGQTYIPARLAKWLGSTLTWKPEGRILLIESKTERTANELTEQTNDTMKEEPQIQTEELKEAESVE
ncbi:M14 family zinc carboxypeptidase [Bacillus tianshenii]|nr:M14 family zinc carboxypeptidase [Bacillus tianshenii]